MLTCPGATIVQYRDKKSDTAQLIENAKALHKVTKPANVPLLINDRVDVFRTKGDATTSEAIRAAMERALEASGTEIATVAMRRRRRARRTR